MENNIKLKNRWSKLDSDRQSVLDRGQDCVDLTIPSLLTDKTHTETDSFKTPYQSLGSRAVNHLASKLLLSLLPPNTPFFRFIPDKIAMLDAEMKQPGSTKLINEQLATIERALYSQIEREALRVPIFSALKLLVATGNALFFRNKNGDSKVFNLTNYVVKRNPEGKVKEIITKESIYKSDLPTEIQDKFTEEEKAIELYTCVKYNIETDSFDAWQEAEDIEIPSSRGVYKKDRLPYLPLRWTAISGEDYGRGLVEQYIGDLRSLEALSMSIVEATAAASKIVFMVNPVGTTNLNTFAKADSGAIIKGNANDVTTVQVNKFNDLRIAYETLKDISQRLSAAFLLNESATRTAERVTAYEVSYMAQELESALGGIYSVLTQELQLPLIKLLIATNKQIKFPKDLIEPVVITGVEALGRGQDYNKLVQFSQTIQQLLGPQIFSQYTNVDSVIRQLGDALGIETATIIKSPEQMQQEQEQAMMTQMAQQGVQNYVDTGAQQAAINDTTKQG